jgi:hypothetical protein
MPPLYDNIVDAFELLPGGSAVALTNVGATYETNDDTEGPQNESVWMKLDLSEYLSNGDVDIEMSIAGVTGDAGFHPYIDVMRVIDPTFDPSAPDFSKLAFCSGVSAPGDGTASPPPVTMTLKGGAFPSPTGIQSATGVYWFYFTDWDYDGTEGSGTVSYSVPEPPLCFDAVDLINPACDTASVVSGRVREDWLDWWDFGSQGYDRKEMTLKFTWAAEAGLYQMIVAGQLAAAGSGVVVAVACVNGRPFIATSGSSFTNTTPGFFTPYSGFDAGAADVYDPSDYPRNPWLPLSPGDVVEIQIMSAADLTGSGFDAFECSSVCFVKDPAAPSSAYCTGAVVFEDAPLGDDWGDVDGWGGQRLIPDEIYAIPANQPGPDDPHTLGADFPWGVNYTDFDMAALESGVVYVFIHDGSTQSSGGTTPAADRHWLAVKKYSPGPGTWSQIATLNVNDPNDRMGIDAVTCEVGPDGMVYVFWWEMDTYTPGTPARYLWKWHLVQLDPSDDSITELGTGQHAETPVTNQPSNHDMLGTHGTTRGASIAFSGGDVYVGLEEIPDIPSGSTGLTIHPYVWRWNSGAWTNLSIPAPSVVSGDGSYEVAGENGFWDVTVNVVAADADGPKADGVTVVYCYSYFDSGTTLFLFPLVTITYTVGSGWGTELLSDFATIMDTADRLNESLVAWHNTVLDISLMWSEKLGKLVMAADIGGNSDQPWDLFQLGADWEVVEALGPGSSSGPWRQSRNSAAIGPDGDVWRGTISDEVDSVDFEPSVLKHAPGYSFGFANGARKPIGRILGWEDPQGHIWDGLYTSMFATTNFRIRWVGNTCYIAANLFAEPQLVDDTLLADYGGDWPHGEGFFVLKGTYVPCGGMQYASLYDVRM